MIFDISRYENPYYGKSSLSWTFSITFPMYVDRDVDILLDRYNTSSTSHRALSIDKACHFFYIFSSMSHVTPNVIFIWRGKKFIKKRGACCDITISTSEIWKAIFYDIITRWIASLGLKYALKRGLVCLALAYLY